MRPFGQAAIWGLANAVLYGLGAASSYGNAIAPNASDRWAFGLVAFGVVLPASTLVAWYVVRARKTTPIRAWRLGGIASCLAAGLVYVPVLYWITATSYVWVLREHPGATDYTLMTFLGGVLALPVIVAANFFIVLAISVALLWMARHLVPVVVQSRLDHYPGPGA